MKPFQLIRTNPALTGNVKLVISENDELFLESFDSTRNLKQSRYKHYEITKDQYWKEVLVRFFDKTDSSDIFAIKQNDIYNTLTSYKNQYDDIYFSGCKIVDDKSYNESYEYSAPLHIKNELPSNFFIFAVDGMSSENFDEYKSNMNLIKTFDLTNNTNIGVFLNNIISDETKPNHPLVIDTTYGLSYINGINLNTSGYINSYFDNNFTHENLPIFRMEDYVTSLFEKNKTIYPDIINMKFLFNDIPSNATSINDYNMSRYVGFYANKKLHASITPYKVLDVINGIEYNSSLKTFVDNNINKKPTKPFDVVWDDNTKYYVYVDKKYYQVVRNNNLYTMIDYKDSVDLDNTKFEANKPITINNNVIIGENISSILYDNNSVYIIEILGKEYTIFNNIIKSYNKIDVDEFKIDTTNNNITTTTQISDLVEFKIYILDFTDIKDFDFDRVSTDQAKFEYDKTHEIIVNDEPKFFAKNHISSNINVYTLVGNQYMRLPRVDTNNNPLYLQDNLGVLNPETNKEYTQYELYTNDNDKNFMLYHDGVNFYDYNLKVVALKQEFIEENGYTYKVTDSNNVEYLIKFVDKKSIYQTADWGINGKDIVSTKANTTPSIDITTPYTSNTYIPASSEYITSNESYELQNNELTKLYEKNQSIVKWGATGSLDIHNYPYRLNYSTDFPIYNSVIPFVNDISVYSRKDMCFDYFYRFNNNLNYSYSFSSLHLPITSFNKFEYDFNEIFISSNINDKGKYNHYSYSTFTTKNKSSRAETIFRNLKISVDNKYNEYKFAVIFASDTDSNDLKHGVNFIIDEIDKNIVMHLYINSNDTITLNNNDDISSCDIKYWYDDIYTKDEFNITQNYIDTGFKINGTYIKIRPQDFALPNIITKIINNDYIAYDKKNKNKIDFNIETLYPDAITVKKKFDVAIITNEDTASIDITNTFDNMNVDGVMTNTDYYKKDFLALSLEQKDTRNIWELDDSDITIYRHSFGFSPIFKNVELFDKSIVTNTKFDTDLYNFGMTSELFLSKTNHYGSILKINDTDSNKSMYPKVDEYGLFVLRKNIFTSNVDNGTFIMNRRYVKDLTNIASAGKAGYFNKSSMVIKDSILLSNENNIIPQLDYTTFVEKTDFNNLQYFIPSSITKYNFSAKLLKYQTYTLSINMTTISGTNVDISTLLLESTNIQGPSLIIFIPILNQWQITYTAQINALNDNIDDLTFDVNFLLSKIPSNVNQGTINLSIHNVSQIAGVTLPSNSNTLYVESGSNYLYQEELMNMPYIFQLYDSNHNNLFSSTKNIIPYIFTDNDKYRDYMTTEPGRFGEEPYDEQYTIPNTWNGLVYFDILNNKLGGNCGNKLKEKIDLGAYGGKNNNSYNLPTIYHFLEYGSQEYDLKNIDPDDYRTFRIGYITGLTYFYLLSGMNVSAKTLNNSYRTFSLQTKKYEDIPTQYLLANNFVNNTLSTDYLFNIDQSKSFIKNSIEILWDVFYNDTTLSFNIKTIDGTKNVDVEINLFEIDSITKKTYTQINSELSAVLLNKYTVSVTLSNTDEVYEGANKIPRYIFTIKSLNSYYTQNFTIKLNTITDFRLGNIVNLQPTISYNEIGKKNTLNKNRVTGRTNDLCVEFFIKTDSFNKKFETIFYKGNTNGDDFSYFIGRDDTSNRLLFRTVHENFFNSKEDNINNYLLNKKSYTTHDLFSNNFINDGQYHHVACVVDYLNRTKTIYIDGKKDNSVTDYLNSEIPDISTRLACFIANTPRFVGSTTQHPSIKNIYTLAYAILDIDKVDTVTKKYAEYWKNTILGNYNFEFADLQFMKQNWKITYNEAFKIFNENFNSLNYSLKTDINLGFDLYIGNTLSNTMSDFTGCLDQIRVWNYARTSDDIYKNYRYDLANTYTSYDKSLVVNINFNDSDIAKNTAIVSDEVTSWFISKNKRIYKTTAEYKSNNYDTSESVFIKYDFVDNSDTTVLLLDDNKKIGLVSSSANIIGKRDEKSNIPDVIDYTSIYNYKTYYSNNNTTTNLSTQASKVDTKLIYKL